MIIKIFIMIMRANVLLFGLCTLALAHLSRQILELSRMTNMAGVKRGENKLIFMIIIAGVLFWTSCTLVFQIRCCHRAFICKAKTELCMA